MFMQWCKRSLLSSLAILLMSSIPAFPQARPQAPPQLVTYSGVAANSDGKPRIGVAGVTFSLFADEQGGAPLWMETQNVTLDSAGGYTAQIGATHPEGLPIDLFASGQARWLEVQVDGQPAAPRVLLMSVPYALKAVDAQTLGGLPASAFALAAPSGNAAGHAAAASLAEPAKAVAASSSAKPAASPETAVTGSGTAGTLPVWTGANTLGNSVIVQLSGNVGIGTSPSGFKLDVSDASASAISGATASSTGFGVEGYASATSGNTIGVYGAAASATGVGVQGENSATTGLADGVLGVTNSTTGNGVQGDSVATTGAAIGVDGIAHSTSGIGVQGHSFATSGSTVGVNGISESDTGIGTQGVVNTTSGTAIGVYGSSVSATGFGVEGYNSATTGAAIGVSGVSDSTSGNGVQGYAPATSGTTIGVYGAAASATGTGVQGQNSATTGLADGVFGVTSSTTGNGVQGDALATTGAAIGVDGISHSSTGIGVQGHALSTTGSTFGVTGISDSPTGTGIQGQATSSTGINYAIVGTSASTQGVGVYGYGAVQSTLGGQLAGNAAGVWGDTHNGSAGVFATADSAEAIAAYNNATNVATLFVENQTDSDNSAIVVATYSDYGGFCDIFVNGNLSCSGSVGGHAFVGPDASREVSLYAMQAPENWFEDAGSGQLHNGAALVTLDAEYAQTVNTGMDYHVFLTPDGDCKGLYVSQKSATSFEVHELGGGNSSIAFDYRIMAKRKGYENVRMADLTGKIQRGSNSKTAAGVRPDHVIPSLSRDAEEPPAPRQPEHAAKAPARAATPGR